MIYVQDIQKNIKNDTKQFEYGKVQTKKRAEP